MHEEFLHCFFLPYFSLYSCKVRSAYKGVRRLFFFLLFSFVCYMKSIMRKASPLFFPSFLFSRPAKKGTSRVSPPLSILMEYVLSAFYDFVVRFIPSSVTPNSITVFGICCTFTSSILLLSSMRKNTLFQPPRASVLPTYSGDPEKNPLGPLYPTVMEPPFFFSSTSLLVLCGILNLLYCIADNADGRVARRDGRSSPVGEYLDHSLDCVTSLLSSGVLFCVCGASSGNMAIGLCSIAMATILCHIFHYETNRFVFGNRVLSVDEAMLFFGIGLWIPLLVPSFAFLAIPFPEVLISWIPTLDGFRWIDFLYVTLFLAQTWTIVGLVCRQPGMPLRVTTLSLLAACIVFLTCIPLHCQIAEVLIGGTGHMNGFMSFLSHFMFLECGPFAYPAVWIITASFTFSSLIHIPIFALCAKLPAEKYSPMVVVFVTLALFCFSPVLGMLWIVANHARQIAKNIRQLLSGGASHI